MPAVVMLSIMLERHPPAGAPPITVDRGVHALHTRRNSSVRTLTLATPLMLATRLVAAALVAASGSLAAQTPTAANHPIVAPETVAPAPSGHEAIPPVSRAQALAAGCTPCHQPAVAGLPALAGQSRQALLAKLEGFRNGTLPGTVMPQLVRGYSVGELDELAHWFAAGEASQ
ncbi:MAG: c-type cytochrome [Casimicrobiaceae bacterium]